MAATAEKMVEEIYAYLDTQFVGVDISPRWRRQGEPLPFITYEVQSVEWVRVSHQFTNCAEIIMSLSCIAETVAEAINLADQVKDAFGVKTLQGNVTFSATAMNFKVNDPTPDDGTGDTERIVTVTATLFVQDEN